MDFDNLDTETVRWLTEDSAEPFLGRDEYGDFVDGWTYDGAPGWACDDPRYKRVAYAIRTFTLVALDEGPERIHIGAERYVKWASWCSDSDLDCPQCCGSDPSCDVCEGAGIVCPPAYCETLYRKLGTLPVRTRIPSRFKGRAARRTVGNWVAYG